MKIVNIVTLPPVLALLGIVVRDLTDQVGAKCKPLSDVGVGSNSWFDYVRLSSLSVTDSCDVATAMRNPSVAKPLRPVGARSISDACNPLNILFPEGGLLAFACRPVDNVRNV